MLGRLPAATVVGITGSSGKTSTKDLTAQVVERLGPTIAPEGSLNNEIGLPLTVLRADETTRYLVLEMSARGIGHIAYLTGIAPPRIGAVLNVGRAHAGEFGSIDAVAKAKGELVEALPAGRRRRGGAQRRRPQRRGDGRPHPGPRGHHERRDPARAARPQAADVRATASPSTTSAAPRSRCMMPRAGSAGHAAAARRATTWPTRWPRRRSRPSSAWTSRRSRTR